MAAACRSLIKKARSSPYDLLSSVGPEVVQVAFKLELANRS